MNGIRYMRHDMTVGDDDHGWFLGRASVPITFHGATHVFHKDYTKNRSIVFKYCDMGEGKYVTFHSKFHINNGAIHCSLMVENLGGPMLFNRDP